MQQKPQEDGEEVVGNHTSNIFKAGREKAVHRGGGVGALTRRTGGGGGWRANEAHGGGGGGWR